MEEGKERGRGIGERERGGGMEERERSDRWGKEGEREKRERE